MSLQEPRSSLTSLQLSFIYLIRAGFESTDQELNEEQARVGVSSTPQNRRHSVGGRSTASSFLLAWESDVLPPESAIQARDRSRASGQIGSGGLA